jgi:hypothetical protein
MAALDTISYFVDEDGDAFFAPDDQPPRRQYKHTTLGRVKANRPVPRYPSPQNFQQQQAYMPPSVCSCYRAFTLFKPRRCGQLHQANEQTIIACFFRDHHFPIIWASSVC